MPYTLIMFIYVIIMRLIKLNYCAICRQNNVSSRLKFRSLPAHLSKLLIISKNNVTALNSPEVRGLTHWKRYPLQKS